MTTDVVRVSALQVSIWERLLDSGFVMFVAWLTILLRTCC
jgi:hypothetical protein